MDSIPGSPDGRWDTEGESSAPKTYELMIVAFLIAIIWVYSCHVFVKSLGGWSHLRMRCRGLAKRCLHPGCGITSLWGEQNKRRAKLQEKQIQRVRAGILFSCFALGAVMVAYFLAAILPADPVISFNLQHHLGIAAIWLGFVLIYLLGEDPCCRCLIRIPYHVCMMTLAVHVMPWSTVSDDRDVIQFLACLFRFAFLPLATDIFSVTFWSAMISSFVWYKHPVQGPLDAVYTAVTIAAFWWLRRATEAEATLQMEMADLRSMRSACHTVLSSVCDAVVELDESMNILEDVHRLGAWLVHGRLDQLRGQEIQQFLHSEVDRDTFVREVSRENHANIAAAFHVKMRDGSGTAIPAECFHAKFEWGSEEKHLIAFREFSDSQALAVPIPSKAEQPDGFEVSEEVKKMQMSGGVAVIEFNALTFETLGATAAFCDKFHGEKHLNQKVVDYLPDKARDRFLQDLTLISNELLNSDSSLAEAELRLPLVVKGQVCKCSCRMTIYKCHFDGPRALGHFDGPRALEQLAFVKGHRMGVEELDLEEERVVVKLFVMEIDDGTEEMSWKLGSSRSSTSGSGSPSRKSRSRSSPRRQRTSNTPECGDLRTLNQRSSSWPLPL